MKKLILTTIIGACCIFAQEIWEPWYLPHDINYQIKNQVGTRGDFTLIWYLGYDQAQHKGRIEVVDPIDLQKYAYSVGQFDDNTEWRDLTGYNDFNNNIFFGGFKKEGQDRYKGILVMREHLTEDHIEIALPYPYNQSGVSGTPVVSIAGQPGLTNIMVSGGNGMILFYDSDGNFIRKANPPYQGDTSDWYIGFETIDGFGVCGDASGIIAKTSNCGVTWYYYEDGFDRDYKVKPDRIHHGKFAPLSVANAYNISYAAIGMNYGHFALEQEAPYFPFELIEVDPLIDTTDSKWWWFTGTSGAGFIQGMMDINYCFSGSDGIILRWDPETSEHYWERYLPPEYASNSDSTYWLTGINFGLILGNIMYRWSAGTKGKMLCAETRYGGTQEHPPTPVVTEPGQVTQLEAVYDPVFEGYRLFWEPPTDYLSTKVGGYWICPTDDEGDWFVMNKAPIRRTTYFVKRAEGSYEDLRVCAMRRDGLAGDWSNWLWLNTIKTAVDDEATGKNNARTLVKGGNKVWAFWQDNNEIYVAYSADTGKHWTYRSTIPQALGTGKWPAADVDNSNHPLVCWVRNIVNGSQVTARIYYARFDGLDWTSADIIREEVLTGKGYLYPSISVDGNNNVHIVFGKNYNNNNSWQLWHGKFPVTDPDNVTWYCLDSTSRSPKFISPSTPTIGTDVFSRPMIIWNRPNSDILYFGYCSNNQWTKYQLSFTGNMPCVEVKGNTAYLTYVNNGDIWYSTGSIKWGFNKPTRISFTLGASSGPTIANNIIAWQEYTNNNDWQIYYSFLQDDLTWSPCKKFAGYQYLPDKNPQIIWCEPYAYVSWTQGISTNIVALSRQQVTTEQGNSPAAMAYNLGDETGAPILVQRSGFEQYSQEPGKSIDRGSILEYRLTGLQDHNEWSARFILYHQSSQVLKCKVMFNNQQTGILVIPPNQIIDKLFHIPYSLIQNGKIDILLESLDNTEAALGGLLIYPGYIKTGGGPQSYRDQTALTPTSIECEPMFINASAKISYTVGEEMDMQLAVYNSIGQCITVLDKGRRTGQHTIHWIPRDNQGNLLPNGIYFLRLETENGIKVKKIVIIR